MKGLVEVYAIAKDGTESLQFRESNLVVDTGHEAIVDMLTTPSSVLGITPSVMDTSNFRMGAISFGPAVSSFRENAYYLLGDGGGRLIDPSVSSWYTNIINDRILRVLWEGSTSAYIPPYQLPSYPDHFDTKLEPDASTAIMLQLGGKFPGITCFGQFENRLNFTPDDTSSLFQGAYANSSGTTVSLVSSLTADFYSLAHPNTTNMMASTTLTSTYNTLSNMDYRGFVSAAPYDTNSSLGRLIFYGIGTLTNPVDFLEDPRVIYETTIDYPDNRMMNLFGGLHQIGLWTIDCTESLKNGTAPFAWIDSNGVTPREFKLFAKKTFTNNLTQCFDDGSTAGLKSTTTLRIKWILDFRSVRDV